MTPRPLGVTRFDGMTCSAAAVDLPLPGTATRVTGWLCIEHPGGWGRDVIGDAVLGPEITEELAARTKAARVRPTLIRRPGRYEFTGTRTVLIASSRQEGSWCERFEITDVKQLLELDLDLLNGPPPGIGAPVRDPLALVCAHGKRDQCCALLGRPIAAALAARYPDQVWECSHTGGHRFAPAMVLLPSGSTYGRVDSAAAIEAVEAARRGAVSLTGLRGRSCHHPVEQAADIAVRRIAAAGADDLLVHMEPENGIAPADYVAANAAVADAADAADPAVTATAVVTHRDGRRWRVSARTVTFDPRQASCGANPKPATAVVAGDPRPLPPVRPVS
ncbi:sucrase ferredoxin [Nocardia sp. NPDC005366]|uniref:sucrase ferredoxin n=1 Tax=Nocardia sp. NPDC005366 TaxID=3156878 RepID=UPI0033A8D6CF